MSIGKLIPTFLEDYSNLYKCYYNEKNLNFLIANDSNKPCALFIRRSSMGIVINDGSSIMKFSSEL